MGLEHHERRLVAEHEKHLVAPPPRARFHWRLMTPPHIVRRVRAHLDALNVDDTALEDWQGTLARHGSDTSDLRPANQGLGRRSAVRREGS